MPVHVKQSHLLYPCSLFPLQLHWNIAACPQSSWYFRITLPPYMTLSSPLACSEGDLFFSRSEQESVLPLQTVFSDSGRALCLCLGRKDTAWRQSFPHFFCPLSLPAHRNRLVTWISPPFYCSRTASIRPQPADWLCDSISEHMGRSESRPSHEKWMCKNKKH